MRFAISLLVIICVASVAGTVLQQNRPLNLYIDQFGPFWAGLFNALSLFNVYNAWWFLVIMAFLVVSTTVCVVRNAPSMMRDSLSFRDKVREGSWRSFPQRAQAHTALEPAAAAERAATWLRKRNFAVRIKANGESRLVAAKAGTGNRLGYIFAHLAIVIICVGGLFDSELPVRLQVMLGGKQPVLENMRIADVPDSGRLGLGNPSFRASALIPEGSQTRNAVVLVGEGALVQPLPFTLQLKDFVVDYYSTGMPSDFVSHVTVTDHDTGESFDATIRVNEPLTHRGITVYQSSFDDGGSRVTVRAQPVDGKAFEAFELQGVVGEAIEVPEAAGGISAVTFTALRPINVENLREAGASQPLALGEHVASVTGSAARDLGAQFQNVGPSIEYQLTDAAGQSVQYHNYMLPLALDGSQVFLLGTRPTPNDTYRYLRIPADANGSLDEFLAMRRALADPQRRQQAASRFATEQGGPADPASQQAVLDSAQRALDVFAEGGLAGMSQFLEQNVPAAELPRAAEVVIRLLGGSMAALREVAREQAGLPPLAYDTAEARQREEAWTRQALTALSDLTLYPAPVFFQLTGFEHLEASVFQLNRAPGKLAVYLGCLLLTLGVFAMFYVRERRLWVWIRPDGERGSQALMAMTSQRRNLDFHREFERLNGEFKRVFPDKDVT